jgi:hypothetical protein
MVIVNSFTFVLQSQEIDTTKSDTVLMFFEPDSVEWQDFMPGDSLFLPFSTDSTFTPISTASPVSPISPIFKPNPTKSVILSAIIPGLGQIYNRKYWKLPLVYGGFMGFSYAIMWNNKNLQDYGDAYKDLTYDLINHRGEPEKWHQSWKDFVTSGADPETRYNENFRSQLKRGRDFYRRNRDLSIILTTAFYLICMADAYVDAQLFDFDISPDLSLRVEPVVNPETNHSARLYGLNCSIKF